MHFLVSSKTFRKKPQSCVVILKFREKLQSHLVETGVGAEGQVVQVDPTMAGQDALHILVKSHVDLVHENLKTVFYRLANGLCLEWKDIGCLVIVKSWIRFTVRGPLRHSISVELVNVEFLHLLWKEEEKVRVESLGSST